MSLAGDGHLKSLSLAMVVNLLREVVAGVGKDRVLWTRFGKLKGRPTLAQWASLIEGLAIPSFDSKVFEEDHFLFFELSIMAHQIAVEGLAPDLLSVIVHPVSLEPGKVLSADRKGEK